MLPFEPVTIVAIKTLKEDAEELDKSDFLAEVQVCDTLRLIAQPTSKMRQPPALGDHNSEEDPSSPPISSHSSFSPDSFIFPGHAAV